MQLGLAGESGIRVDLESDRVKPAQERLNHRSPYSGKWIEDAGPRLSPSILQEGLEAILNELRREPRDPWNPAVKRLGLVFRKRRVSKSISVPELVYEVKT